MVAGSVETVVGSDTDSTVTFAQLGLDKHLSPTRRNGLHSMVSRVRALAGNFIVETT